MEPLKGISDEENGDHLKVKAADGLNWEELREELRNLFKFNPENRSWWTIVKTSLVQSWKMSNLLHGPISTNQILPREKRVNRDIFCTSNLQNRTYGVSCDE